MNKKQLAELRKWRQFEEEEGHYSGIVPNEWMTDESFPKLVAKIQKEFSKSYDVTAIWFIPMPENAKYQINQFNGNPILPEGHEPVFIGSFKL